MPKIRRGDRLSVVWGGICLGAAVFARAVFFSGMRAAAAEPPSSSQSPPGHPYVWRNVTIGGGGFVTGLVFHPAATNLLYARTDVGGAYRWDDRGRSWVPLTDWIGGPDGNLAGIESLAVDPADPKRVYLAAGTYHQGAAAMFRSDDQGETFQRTDVPFAMGANEAGRFNGERLAVDPNEGEILFFGSRRDGLWRSGDRGVSWERAGGFPKVDDGPARPTGISPGTNVVRRFRRGFGDPTVVGIVAVVFDPASGRPGAATPKIFAAVSVLGTNLYCSADAGVTWQAVAGQPVGLRPNHLVLSPNGTLYLTYGREPGPNDMGDGAVWKFDPKHAAWTNITPLKPADADQSFGYGAVAVDPRHPATVMVATFGHWRPHDLIFRSTDAGASWRQLWRRDTIWDHASAPYTAQRTPHWIGSLAINPFDPDQVLLTTGYGIWSGVNATEADAGRPTRWIFLDDGLEETVPLALLSPPEGAHLLSGVGDIDGFRHDNLEISPAGGAFAGPRYANTEDLAFAAQQPLVIVRTGTGEHQVRAALSRDGGTTWRALAGEPPAGRGGGTIAISANARTIVWTPQGGEPFFTLDEGVNWAACAGLSAGTRVVADPVNPLRFYAWDGRAGGVMASSNAAASFAPAGAAGLRFPGNAAVTAAPGREGDLWLAARGAGLFHSTNGGGSFRRLAAVAEARSLGFGKAAPGKPCPALYLAGKAGGTAGVYRSDNAGESWVRINDDRHQFGYVGAVAGDPRIYGRAYLATGGRGIIYGDIGRP